MGHPRFSCEEITRLGKELYSQRIRAKVETEGNLGKMICIDIKTGDYEIDDESIRAARRLTAKHPGAAIYGTRIGYPAAYTLGGVLTPAKQ